MSQIHPCGEEKKAPIDTTMYWQTWCKTLSFHSVSLRKCCYEMLTTALVSFLPIFPTPQHSLAEEQPCTWTKSLFLKCNWQLKKGFHTVSSAGTENRGRMRRVKKKWIESCKVPENTYLTLGSTVRNIRGPNLLMPCTQCSKIDKHMPQC